MIENKPAVTPLIDLLRRCSHEAWAEITEPNGWSYHTNIGKLLHDAADEIERIKRIKYESPTLFVLPEGDCIPMSYDGGKTWCVEYDYIQSHPEKEWKSWIEVCCENKS